MRFSSLLIAALVFGLNSNDAGCVLPLLNEPEKLIPLRPFIETPDAAKADREGLARELELPYASLCIVVNPGAGLAEELITLAAMGEVLAQAAQQVSATLVQFLAAESG